MDTIQKLKGSGDESPVGLNAKTVDGVTRTGKMDGCCDFALVGKRSVTATYWGYSPILIVLRRRLNRVGSQRSNARESVDVGRSDIATAPVAKADGACFANETATFQCQSFPLATGLGG